MSTNTQTPIRPTDEQTKHDPTWMPQGEVIHVKKAESDLPMWARENDTDYEFPNGFWGEQWSDEERCEWFLETRVYRQTKRQWEAGAHEVSQAKAEAHTNSFRKQTNSVDTSEYR